uniref:USP domain-containing protein n=1 Tax=Macrostomum lignano TaxID=282301 RepID=A0A1I8FHK4_9PLAT
LTALPRRLLLRPINPGADAGALNAALQLLCGVRALWFDQLLVLPPVRQPNAVVTANQSDACQPFVQLSLKLFDRTHCCHLPIWHPFHFCLVPAVAIGNRATAISRTPLSNIDAPTAGQAGDLLSGCHVFKSQRHLGIERRPGCYRVFRRGAERLMPPKMPTTCWCARRRRRPGPEWFQPLFQPPTAVRPRLQLGCQSVPSPAPSVAATASACRLCLSELWRPGSGLDRRQAWLCPSCGAFGQRAIRRQRLRPPLPPTAATIGQPFWTSQFEDFRPLISGEEGSAASASDCYDLLAVAWRYRCFQQQYVVYVRSRHGDAGACRWQPFWKTAESTCLSAD